MEHYQNFSLENLTEEFEGIIYTEEWKDIKGYEGYYQVSSFGRVKSLAKTWSVGIKLDTILKSGWDKQGYRKVAFCVDKVKKITTVHRLVAAHFCENPNNYGIVNHLDSKTNNNRSTNLEWTTYSGNAVHGFEFGFRKGRKGLSHHNTKITEQQVREIKEMWGLKKASQGQIAKQFGVGQMQVSRIVRNKQWIHIN